jgi:hypothetical protein
LKRRGRHIFDKSHRYVLLDRDGVINWRIVNGYVADGKISGSAGGTIKNLGSNLQLFAVSQWMGAFRQTR